MTPSISPELLKLHLPMLVLRKTHHDDAAALAPAAANLAEIYGAQTSRSRLAPGAARMLEAVRTGDGAQLVATAQAIRDNPNDDERFGSRPRHRNQ